MANQPELITLKSECQMVTDDAVLVESDWGVATWIPRSQITFELDKSTWPWEIEYTIPVWLANKKGLI